MQDREGKLVYHQVVDDVCDIWEDVESRFPEVTMNDETFIMGPEAPDNPAITLQKRDLLETASSLKPQ